MPWEDENYNTTIAKAKGLIQKHFDIYSDVKVYFCTLDEVTNAVVDELTHRSIDPLKIEKIRLFVLPDLLGKYFNKLSAIWLIDGRQSYAVLIHELLHSIQLCDPNHEKITDYITYKLTRDKLAIDSTTLKEWREIEKTYGFKRIKKRYILVGDCEELDF